MADTNTLDAPQVDQNQGQPQPFQQPGPGPQQPAINDENKQRLVKIIQNMQKGGESDDNIRAVVKRFQEVNGSPLPSTTPIDKGVRETTKNLNAPIQFNGTFTPDLEGEKKGLYLNDPDYQKQKNDFVQRIATDSKGNLLYPEKDDKTARWSNYYTKQLLPNFDPSTMQGKILQVPHQGVKQGLPQFVTPKYDQATNSYNFPGVQTPDVPTQQTLPEATVYGKTKGAQSNQNFSGASKVMVDESKKQGGQLADVLNNHPDLGSQIDKTLAQLGPEYAQSLATGSGAMSNVLQKTVEQNYDLNKALPNNVDPNILDGHLSVVNNFEKNRQQFESNQSELQRQADLLQDQSKRTGQPIDPQDVERLAQKSAENNRKWQEYTKSVNFSQNYLNQPEVKQYLNEFSKRKQGLQLIDEINQRAFPKDTDKQIQQDQYDRKAIEGNLNAWDYTKTALGQAAKGLSNIGETALKVVPGAVIPGASLNGSAIEGLNNSAQQYLTANLPAISPDAIKQMDKLGLGHMVNDLSSTVGGFAPYIIPGMAGEGLAAKGATFATALAEGLPQAKQEALKQGLTGAAFNTFTAAKPLVSAAFMTLLPNVKFAKGFDNDVAKAVVNGEFNASPLKTMLNLAKKVVTPHPEDIAHLQAMLSGSALGEALVNKVTNGLQATQDLDRGISRKEGLPVELSNVFNPRQTAVMAIAGKVMEAIPTLKNSIGDLSKGKEVQQTYDNIQNNLVELAGHNLEGVSNKVNELVKKDPGNIYAQHLKTTLEDFAQAKTRMPSGLEPEQQAALFDIQKKIVEKQRQMATADPVYAPHLQKNIDELTKQISDITKDPKAANKYLGDAHKDLQATLTVDEKPEEKENTEQSLTAQRDSHLGDIDQRIAGLDKNWDTHDAQKEMLTNYRKAVEDDYAERISKLKPAKTEETASPQIHPDANFRTLDYGSHKGKEETKEAQKSISDDIVNDRPIGGDGEKLSDFLGRIIPGVQKVMSEDPHNTTIVTHSSVIKALRVWEDMGRPDISELTGDKLKDFAQKYADEESEKEGKVHTFKGDDGKEIKVVRHGETEDNKLSEFREDDTQLTDKGKNQAAKAGDNLIKETGGNVPKIISSDLDRTMNTAQIIHQKLSENAIPKQAAVTQTEHNGLTVDKKTANSEGIQKTPIEGKGPVSGKSDGGQPERPPESREEQLDGAGLIKEGGPSFINEGGENEFTSTKNEITRKKIEDAGLKPPMEDAAREFGTVWKDAQEKLAKGFDIENLVKSLDQKPRAVTDLENAMILFHQNVKESQLTDANKDIADATDKDDRLELEDAIQRRAKILDDLQHIYNVDKKIGRETARGLNARKMMTDRRFSLVNMQLEKRAAAGGEPLSDAEMNKVKEQYEEIKRTKEALDARIAELEKENARLAAAKTVAEQSKGTGKTRKTGQQFKTERKDIVNRMREDLLKAAKGGGGLTASIPFAAQLAAIAPHMKDLVKSFIEQGVDKLEDITKGVYDLLKPDMPELEERHIHDLIAGEYNQPSTEEKKGPSTYQQVKAAAKVQKYRATDSKTMKLQADYERAKEKYQQSLNVDERKSRTTLQKTQDAFLKYERFAKLSNPVTLGKLAMAAITRIATTPIEEAVGGLYSAGLPGIAKKAPGEAGVHVSALARGYKQAFMKGLDDAATVAKGGKSDIAAVFGKKEAVAPEAMDFFGQLHSAIKAPVKRFAFERSFQKRIANNIKNGVTIDGLTEARIAVEAYKDAERSIFMQDNLVAKGWRGAMTALEKKGEGGKLAATIGQWLVPFVKVPSNIIAETISHVAGPEIALTQIISKALGKGLSSLSQDEAESIMRNLKKGTIGHVALWAGYMNPQMFGGYYQKGEKRDEKDVKPGAMKLGDTNIPAWALEAPLFQAMQIGATVRRIKDTMVKGEAKGIGEGIMGGALGLLAHEPLLDEPARLQDALSSDKERSYFFGELAKSTLVPAAVEYAAKVFDPADTRPTGEKLIDPENKRKPGTLTEHVESGIPGLRENVATKQPKSGGHRQRRGR